MTAPARKRSSEEESKPAKKKAPLDASAVLEKIKNYYHPEDFLDPPSYEAQADLTEIVTECSSRELKIVNEHLEKLIADQVGPFCSLFGYPQSKLLFDVIQNDFDSKTCDDDQFDALSILRLGIRSKLLEILSAVRIEAVRRARAKLCSKKKK
jgi:hypothetical protein